MSSPIPRATSSASSLRSNDDRAIRHSLVDRYLSVGEHGVGQIVRRPHAAALPAARHATDYSGAVRWPLPSTATAGRATWPASTACPRDQAVELVVDARDGGGVLPSDHDAVAAHARQVDLLPPLPGIHPVLPAQQACRRPAKPAPAISAANASGELWGRRGGLHGFHRRHGNSRFPGCREPGVRPGPRGAAGGRCLPRARRCPSRRRS